MQPGVSTDALMVTPYFPVLFADLMISFHSIDEENKGQGGPQASQQGSPHWLQDYLLYGSVCHTYAFIAV